MKLSPSLDSLIWHGICCSLFKIPLTSQTSLKRPASGTAGACFCDLAGLTGFEVKIPCVLGHNPDTIPECHHANGRCLAEVGGI